MPSIVPPDTDLQAADWRLPPDFWTIRPKALGASLHYEGPFPPRPVDYYALAGTSHRVSFVYVLSGSRPVYVGRSWRPGNRFDKHRRNPWFADVRNLTLLRIEGEDRRECDALVDALETYTIRRLKPTQNIAKVVR